MRLRFFAFRIVLILLFAILFFRLFELMIIQGDNNRRLAEGQRVRIKKITSPRGIIFDRNNKPLVRNVPIYKICKDDKCRELTHEDALSLEVAGKDADLLVEIGREYPYGESMAHLLGYLGEVNEKEVEGGKWEVGKVVGRMGIEQQYEGDLAGVNGGELIEVDTRGIIVRKIGKRDPVAGQNITLSIDANLQQTAYQLIKGKKGAVVVQNADGQVLALVSSPSFDPNVFVRVSDLAHGEGVKEILTNPNYPLFNRTIGGAYPPGSTFKIISSTAALEEKKIDKSTLIEDTGQIVIGPYRFANWYFTSQRKTEGFISVSRALARSTDTFFYKVGEMVGGKKIVEWGKKFGLAKTTGIDLPGEVSGFLPNPESSDWFLGNTYHLAIGQGHLGLTPLQVNRITGVIANGGKLCKPRIRIDDKGWKIEDKSERCQDLGLKGETLNLIKEGMKQACSPGGTAGSFSSLPFAVACKTGTAEFDDPSGKTHAWFTAFAPAYAEASAGEPEIVVTVLVEAGGEGSSVAAPIAKEILKEYFRK